ncbi:MAG: hypothetical protein L6R41_000158 [Letrouitia leprolyta]|nr:MAG: hypothetical protein L6R41_000158 [Letrouitia leprolyta]
MGNRLALVTSGCGTNLGAALALRSGITMMSHCMIRNNPPAAFLASEVDLTGLCLFLLTKLCPQSFYSAQSMNSFLQNSSVKRAAKEFHSRNRKPRSLLPKLEISNPIE